MRIARLRPALRSSFSVAAATGTLALLLLIGGPVQTENAVANGDTRAIHLYHTHSKESIAATYMVDGRYDTAVLQQLNHFLRDWRNNDEINMDPKLFDVIWETYRESGSAQPIQVVSAYRSPTTNAMLRSRSKLVAEHSQHMLGKAMDMHYTDVPMSKIREIGLRLQRGGVGYYPTSNVPFVHLDVGNVRYWPRMSYPDLARLFPDGKAVFLAADGRMLPHYQEARAEIASRTGDATERFAEAAPQPKSFFASLFGGSDEPREAPVAPVRSAEASPPAQTASLRSTLASDPRKADARAGNLVWQTGAPGQPLPDIDAVSQDRPVPLPPHRPIELASLTRDIPAALPLPPSRPAQILASTGLVPSSDGVTPLLRAANVPAVITRGIAMPAASPTGAVLAYAPLRVEAPVAPTIQAVRTAASPRPAAMAPAVGLRAATLQKPVEFVAARLDPSNFILLVAPVSIARSSSGSELGSAVGALRTAARFTLAELVFGPPSPVAAHFASVASDLQVRNFAGRAVRPIGLSSSESKLEPLRTAKNSGTD